AAFGVPALGNHIERRPQHLFTPLIGRAGVVRLHSHGYILAETSDLGTCLHRSVHLWTSVPVSRLNIQSNMWRRAGGTGAVRIGGAAPGRRGSGRMSARY